MLDERKTAILSAVVQEYIATALPVGSTHIADAPGDPGVAGDGAQRDGRARAGGLPRPAAHVGRADPDRQGLPLLRRPPRDARAARPAHQRHGRRVLRLGPRPARGDAAPHVRPARPADQLRRRRRRAEGRGRGGALGAARRPLVDGGDGRRRARQRRGRERDDRARRRRHRRPGRRRRAATSHAHCAGRPLSWHALPSTGDHAVDAICASALGALVAGSASEHVYMGGTSAMVSAFDAVDIVRDVLRTLEQQFVVVSLVSDILNRGMSVAIGVEHGVQPLSACSVVVAPVVVDGEHRGSVGVLGPTRMNYPQALATVEVVSERLGQRFEAAEAGARWLTSTSCSACRGRPAPTSSSGRTAARPASCTPTPTPTPAPPRSSRRCRGPTRCSPTPSSGPATTASARPASPAPRAAGRRSTTSSPVASATCSARSSAAASAAVAGAVRAARRAARTWRPSPRSRSSRRCSAPPCRSRCACRSAAPTATAAAPAAARKPVTCVECSGTGQVQRVRQSLLGQMVTTSPCPRCGGLGQVIVTPCPTCRGEGRVTAEHTYQVDVPAGVDNGSTLRLDRSRRGRSARWRQRRPLRPPARAAARALPARRRRPRHRRSRSRSPRRRSARRSSCRRSTATRRSPCPPGTQPGKEFVLRQRGVPRLQGRGRGDLRAELVVEVPTKLVRPGGASCSASSPSCAARRSAPPDKGLFSRIKSAFQ